jgi:branched-chain amino acid transport system substrate-binding protein
MSKRLFPACVVLVAAIAAAAAGASPTATPGVTSTSITLGGTAPLSGEASAAGNVARGADAYFKYVNDHGGVNGRKILYKYLDDGYEPARTVQATRQLVQQENVFAMFNTLGTNNNLAIRQFLNQEGVPQLFVAAGATTFGKDAKRYPWTIGYIPSYAGEGEIYGRYVLKTMPKAKIAVLYQDDDYGNDLVGGLKKGLGRKASLIVKKVGYDPTSSDVRSQVAQLKASKANTLCIFAFGKFAIQAYTYVNQLNWRPKIFINDVASASGLMQLEPRRVAEGSISIVFGKDPATPAFARDAGVKLGKAVLRKYVSGANTNDGYFYAGMGAAYTMVDTLKKAGRNPTRQGVMNAATHLNEKRNPFLIPGIVVRTSPRSRYPISQVKLQRWHNGHWVIFGPLLDAKP